jgi:hypothetical protein
MDQISILFIQEHADSFDGASIFNKRLCEALIKKGLLLKTLNIKFKRKRSTPIWLHEWSDDEVRNVKNRVSKNTILIISHEKYFGLANWIDVDIAIYHNVISLMKSEFRVLELLYKSGSARLDNLIALKTQATVVLSPREQKLLSSKYEKVSLLVPGVKSVYKSKPLLNRIKIINTDGWIFKRLSKIDVNMLREYGYEITNKDVDIAMIHIIEDRFTTGTKLKLVDSIARGDALCCHQLLIEDIIAFGLEPNAIFWFNSKDDLKRLPSHDWNFKAIHENAKIMSQYDWSHAANILGDVIKKQLQK